MYKIHHGIYNNMKFNAQSLLIKINANLIIIYVKYMVIYIDTVLNCCSCCIIKTTLCACIHI